MIAKPIKHILFLFFFLSMATTTTWGQVEVSRLMMADSLFKDKKFTESFELYDKILNANQKSSPQMLLKMAYINEGLRDYSQALYYLNLYYLQTSDKKALKKMEKLAGDHKLVGYEYSDWEFFLMLYRKYNPYITYLLIGLTLLLFGIMIQQKFYYKKRPLSTGIILTCMVGLLFYHINFSNIYNKGIVVTAQSYLMEGPSSGADLVEIIEKGHRVNVRDKKDVWVEIEWDGKTAYIRENNITTIR